MVTTYELRYELHALEPHISRETMQYHYGKHYSAYVARANELIAGTRLAELPLDEIVRQSSGPTFDAAAQAWNHAFFWKSLRPPGGDGPTGDLAGMINRDFGSYEIFKAQFADVALGVFGSGWVWLVMAPSGHLLIEATSNAGAPASEDGRPLLTCDVWEHAYYIDYRNARADYVAAFWHVVDWAFAGRRLAG